MNSTGGASFKCAHRPSAVRAVRRIRWASARHARSPSDSPAALVRRSRAAASSASSRANSTTSIPFDAAQDRLMSNGVPRSRFFCTISDQLTAEIAAPFSRATTCCHPGSRSNSAKTAEASRTHGRAAITVLAPLRLLPSAALRPAPQLRCAGLSAAPARNRTGCAPVCPQLAPAPTCRPPFGRPDGSRLATRGTYEVAQG